MYRKTIYIVILLTIYLSMCNLIYKRFTPVENTKKEPITQETKAKPIITEKSSTSNNSPQKDSSIGKLIIDKISLSQNLYPMDSPKNNIEQNVTILKYSELPSINNSIMFIAAHSGTGRIAYFKNLHKLNIDDTIKLEYQNIKYTYQIKDVWEVKKNGHISVEKEDVNQLVLTTCSPTKDNYQLIINSILIKKES